MKKISLFLFGISALLSGCQPKADTFAGRLSVVETPQVFRYRPGLPARVSAHRGGGNYPGYPENALESFAYLVGQTPMIIECDIDLTRDSVLMLLHDKTLDRTTTGTGPLINKTWAECQEYRLEDNFGTATNFRIPTLEQALRWGKDKCLFTLDVKRGVPFTKVVDMIHRTNAASYAAVITYNAPDAATVYRLDPQLMISVSIGGQEDYERLRAAGVPDQNMIAFVGTAEPDPALYQFLHTKGIACILGVLGNLDKQAETRGDQQYRTFVQNGADILATDRPLEVAQALR
ncbi:glycerophosphodiester phosphodiesterase family protein [Hymenobacter sp. BT188]|uniref:glycerophosphodiester phosphodiesterase family protein n=1 Tax=Hymenobacter sp. BT188 TaxID=2763504 RepID=UPI001651858C|nr:glycerophosphodiester phosphodiesterase family protein [Hymenobacter sp. BT188]MBC6608032.1 glycerophosphodiester phosphodiesterase family protein [Hymenobacter sp. BT188]